MQAILTTNATEKPKMQSRFCNINITKLQSHTPFFSLLKLISSTQGTFVAWWQIIDNIVKVQEVLLSFPPKKMAKGDWWLVKYILRKNMIGSDEIFSGFFSWYETSNSVNWGCNALYHVGHAGFRFYGMTLLVTLVAHFEGSNNETILMY